MSSKLLLAVARPRCLARMNGVHGRVMPSVAALSTATMTAPAAPQVGAAAPAADTSAAAAPTAGAASAAASSSSRSALSDLDKFDIGAQAAAQQQEDEYEEEMFEDPRLRILDAALAHVPRDGWSMEALAAGANDLGYPAVSSGMFDKGAAELVWHVMRKANVHMSETLEGMDLASLSVNQRVKAGVQARLSYFASYQKSWAQAMALGLQPSALPETLTLLAVAADEIWYWAGDRSTDMNWYTRRLLLMGVMAATETAMLTDRSPGHADTWEFLDRRLQEVTLFGRSVGENLSVLAAAAGGLGSLASAGFDLLRPFIVRGSGGSGGSGSGMYYSPLDDAAAGGAGSGAGQEAGTGGHRAGAAAEGVPGSGGASAHASGSSATRSSGFGGSTGTPFAFPSPPSLPFQAGAAFNPAQGAAQAAAAAASAAQALAAQAAQVASQAGVKLPDPAAVLGVLGSLLPPSGGLPGARPAGSSTGGPTGYARGQGPVQL